jgi:hypothetical protein
MASDVNCGTSAGTPFEPATRPLGLVPIVIEYTLGWMALQLSGVREYRGALLVRERSVEPRTTSGEISC